jgi:hypothetical protein
MWSTPLSAKVYNYVLPARPGRKHDPELESVLRQIGHDLTAVAAQRPNIWQPTIVQASYVASPADFGIVIQPTTSGEGVTLPGVVQGAVQGQIYYVYNSPILTTNTVTVKRFKVDGTTANIINNLASGHGILCVCIGNTDGYEVIGAN